MTKKTFLFSLLTLMALAILLPKVQFLLDLESDGIVLLDKADEENENEAESEFGEKELQFDEILLFTFFTHEIKKTFVGDGLYTLTALAKEVHSPPPELV